MPFNRPSPTVNVYLLWIISGTIISSFAATTYVFPVSQYIAKLRFDANRQAVLETVDGVVGFYPLSVP